MVSFKKLNILLSLLILISLFIPYLFGGGGLSFAQTSDEEKEMEAKIKELEEKITKYRTEITANQRRARTLQTEISILDSEINKAELEIKRIDLAVQRLERKIAEKKMVIREAEREVDLEKTALSELIREISKYDDVSYLEIVLGRAQLSDFLSEVNSLENFQNQIQQALTKISNLKANLEQEKALLTEEKEEQIGLRAIQDDQRATLESKQKEKKNLLVQTKGQEQLFTQLIKKTQLDIEAVKNKLYFLKGFIGDGSLRFEEAYKFAKFASIYTGVRPAFLLAILSRESELGKNVGTGSWRTDMKPSQRPYYLQICEKLNISPDTYPVSKKQWYGWGGAMGPAQFMPATWLGYEQRIAEITGSNPPSPWDIKDAFVAAALYLANKGADQKTYNSEWRAAMVYLAGSRWNRSYLSFYGDQVMVLANQFQEQIDILEKG
ncbi:MAG: lytic murein transglycosylase [Patescibacteria group bacterium]